MSSRRKPPHLAGASDQPVEIAQTSHSSAGPWSGGNRGRTASIDTARRSRTAPLRWCGLDQAAAQADRASHVDLGEPPRARASVFQDIEDDRHKPTPASVPPVSTAQMNPARLCVSCDRQSKRSPADVRRRGFFWSRWGGPEPIFEYADTETALLEHERYPAADHAFAAPTVSAIRAPRAPSGFSGPSVVSRAV